MPTIRNTPAFAGLVSLLLERGAVVRFRANGCSMGSAIRDGEAVYVAPLESQNPQIAEKGFSLAATMPQDVALETAEKFEGKSPRLQPGETIQRLFVGFSPGHLIEWLKKPGLKAKFRDIHLSPRLKSGAFSAASLSPSCSDTQAGEILLTCGPAGFKAHRLVSHDFDQNLYITQGDSVQMEDTPVRVDQILGRVIALERHSIFTRLARRCAWMLRRLLS